MSQKENTSQLLINEPPLQVQPSLAVKIGDLDEAIIIQQIHYWLQRSKAVKDGHVWVFNTYEKWHEQFPFWSISKIRSKFKSLENKGYLITGNFNKMKIDRTKWYRINYKKLNETLHDKPADLNTSSAKTSNPTAKSSRSCVENKQTNRQDLAQRSAQSKHTSNHRLPETNTENKYIYSRVDHSAKAEPPKPQIKKSEIPYKQIVDYLNRKAGTHYRSTSKNTRSKIKSRFNEGFTASDFKIVIDKKCKDWLADSEMVNYLRPETLFGTKFESYLNQPTAKPQPRIRSQGKVVEHGTDWSKKKAKVSGDLMSDAEMDAIFNDFGGAGSSKDD